MDEPSNTDTYTDNEFEEEVEGGGSQLTVEGGVGEEETVEANESINDSIADDFEEEEEEVPAEKPPPQPKQSQQQQPTQPQQQRRSEPLPKEDSYASDYTDPDAEETPEGSPASTDRQTDEDAEELKRRLQFAEAQMQKVKELEKRLIQNEQRQMEEMNGDEKDEKILELQELVMEKSNELVAQGEKNYQMQRELEDVSEKWNSLKEDVATARAILIEAIAGEDAKGSRYKHVKIQDLVKLHVTEISTGKPLGSLTRAGGSTGVGIRSKRGKRLVEEEEDTYAEEAQDNESRPSTAKSTSSAIGTSNIVAAEQEIRNLKNRNRKLYDQIQELEAELDEIDKVAQDVHRARGQVQMFADKLRFEKEKREMAERRIQEGEDKIEALSEHIEKLMVHLKHEAAAKAKAQEAQRRMDQELQALKNRTSALARKNAAREKLINELKEGSKILEDQLRLMDEKYIELRGKLDWTRTHSQKEVKRARKEADRVREKWMMAESMGFVYGDLDSDAPPRPGRLLQQSGSRGGMRSSAGLTSSASESGLPSKLPRAGAGLDTKPGSLLKNRLSSKRNMNGSPKGPVVAGTSSLADRAPPLQLPEGIESSLDSGDVDSTLPWSSAQLSKLQTTFKQ